MKLESLNEFLVLNETRNYLEASEQLFISQATLSRHIQVMEEELGVQLFYRSTRRVELTEIGARMIPYARQAVALQRDYQQMIAQENQMLDNTLTIGAFRQWNRYDLPEVLMNFQLSDKLARIDMHTGSSTELLKGILDESYRFAFLREASNQCEDDLIRVPYCKDTLRVFVSERHPLTQYPEVSIGQLHNENFLLPEDSSLAYRLCIEMCEKEGFHPHFTFRGLASADIYRLIQKNLGLAVLIQPSNSEIDLPGIVTIPLKTDICVYVNLVYAKERKLHSADKRFLQFISEKKLSI